MSDLKNWKEKCEEMVEGHQQTPWHGDSDNMILFIESLLKAQKAEVLEEVEEGVRMIGEPFSQEDVYKLLESLKQ